MGEMKKEEEEMKKEEDEMKKVHETDDSLKVNNTSDGEGNCCSGYSSQGAIPKHKNHICTKENKGITIQNGSATQKKKISVQNGASCSSSVSTSSSSSSVNKMLNDLHETIRLDHSAEKCLAKGRTLSSEDNDLRYHDKKRKTGSFADNESSSGNEGDEGLSADDCCIYTYKGDQFADLPNSFFPVDMPPHEGDQPLRDNHRRELRPERHDGSNPGSSPEMDYLEMDFDPGPSLEQDSEEEVDGLDRKVNKDSPAQPNIDQMVVDSKEENSLQNHVESQLFENMELNQGSSEEPQPGPSNFKCSPKKYSTISDCNSNNFVRTNNYLSDCESTEDDTVENFNCLSEESVNEGATAGGNDNSKVVLTGERLDKEVLTEKSDLCDSRNNESKVDQKTPFDGIMLWTEQEAISKQVTLVSPDVSCGATAVINAMLVLKMRFSIEKVTEGISTRLKSDSASIPQYLVSRSFAGVAHENLIRGIHHASHGALYARFFQMYPRRNVVLSRWLSYWMQKGAVPIATMNVQRDANIEDSSLDTRHHQTIFGVNSKGIYLTDPLECLQDEELWCRLVSPSVLKIKRNEIVSRWSPGTNLKPLMFQSDDRWKKMNVLGQVVNIIRESPDPAAQGKFLTPYISIPASSGITLVIPRESSGYEELVSTADLPLLSSKPE